MTTQQHIKLGQQTALISCLLGTVIFGSYVLTPSIELLLIGYAYIALAGLINMGILTSIVLKANKDKDNRKKLFATCGLMLLNIPVMLFYCWITMRLLDTMCVTFTNATPATLTDINILGCGAGHIDKLEAGESQTVWVGITGDCSIKIDYLSNGQKMEEGVTSYVTRGMGQKLKHHIGGQNNAHF